MSAGAALPAAWRAQLAARLEQPPLRPRLPLWWAGRVVGSVEPGLLEVLEARVPGHGLLQRGHAGGEPVVEIVGEPGTELVALAQALRAAGLAHAWRDEPVAVAASDGTVLGRIERAVVRPLGLATVAVHLAGHAPDGRHWVQQRALDKPNDPGLWDTLVGGMVPACDTPAQALERETWEEAGLRLPQLGPLRWIGRLQRRGPSGDGGFGYVVETIEAWRVLVPEGVVPRNQDGEVARFDLLAPGALCRGLQAGDFTLEAAAVLAADLALA